ncbi:MAG TPA: ATP-binding cassette domain-containing protein [Bacilli bacterium]|nr:ATP-binding cassette domain-containing protein [Bacilli bacterium]
MSTASNKVKAPLIETRKLKKYFPLKRNSFFDKNQLYVRAVEDLTMNIYKGETLGLVGESGCGKSTLGRSILQLYPLTSGSAIYYGKTVEEFNPSYVIKEIRKLPKRQAAAQKYYEKSVVIDGQVSELNKELKSITPSTETQKNIDALTAKIKKLEVQSKELKKSASRELREGSTIVGSLILESDIHSVVEKMLVVQDILKEIRVRNEVIAREKRMINIKTKLLERQSDDQLGSEISKEDIQAAEKVIKTKQEEIVELRKQLKDAEAEVEKLHGKQPLPITERALEPAYQKKLDGNKEHGINLTRLNKEEMRKLRQELQIIFQDPYSSLNPRMTVGQIIEEAVIEHGMFQRGTPELEQYVLDTMLKCGLDKYMLHRYPHQFSGGQRQRIGIARALALKPKFIVCDEAVSALDVSIQSQIINLLVDLKDQSGLTYLFISHDLSVIRHISDRIGVMYLGQMVELGDSEEIYQNPLHPYTKALLSAIPTTEKVQKERILLKGDIPSNIFPPSGCKFRTRCPIATEFCAQEVPEYREITPGHYVACHYYEKTASIK